MVARRSHGTGSLVERPEGSGKWYFRYVTGRDPVTGRLRRRAVTIAAKNKSAAQVKARKILSEAESVTTGTSVTVNQLLVEWMRFQYSRGRSPTTLNGYQNTIDVHIKPALGDIKIETLTAHDLDSLYAKCSHDGKKPRTVRNIHTIISAALNQAVKWEWLDRNPALRAKLPEAAPLKLEPPTPEQARALIAACQQKDEVLGAFVFLAAVTGCRRGEVAALRWNSFHDGLLVVRESAFSVKSRSGVKPTKSGRERVVYLDPTVQQWLSYWRIRCENLAREWEVSIADDAFIVSSRPDGSRFVSLDKMSTDVRKIANRLGIPHIHLHSLRHFAATELLAAGISANDAAEMLGHADPSLTLRVYAHATTDRQKAAASVLARVIQGPETRSLT